MTDDEFRPFSAIGAVPAARLPRDGETIKVRASEAERAAIAGRLGVLSVEALEATLVAAPWRRDGASLRGRLKAVVLQESVVSLQAVRQEIEEPVDLTYLPQSPAVPSPGREEAGTEIELDPEGEDGPDVLVGGAIDAAAALEELLALALDPYPRDPQEAFEDPTPLADMDEAPPSPFAGLAALKDKRNDG